MARFSGASKTAISGARVILSYAVLNGAANAAILTRRHVDRARRARDLERLRATYCEYFFR